MFADSLRRTCPQTRKNFEAPRRLLSGRGVSETSELRQVRGTGVCAMSAKGVYVFNRVYVCVCDCVHQG
jgi:hypothetical protein